MVPVRALRYLVLSVGSSDSRRLVVKCFLPSSVMKLRPTDGNGLGLTDVK